MSPAVTTATSATTITRTLSLHERYAVARRSIDSASVVSAAALLTLDTRSSSQDFTQAFDALKTHLGERIDAALSQYPLLAHCVKHPRSRAPRWAPMSPVPTSKDVLQVGPTLSLPSEGDEDHSKLLSKAILAEQNSLPASTDLENGVLWKVLVSKVLGGDKPMALVVLSTDHVINDGRGTLNLFQHLLSRSTSQPSSTAQSSNITIPPKSEEIFNFKPTIPYLLGVVWEELILPTLPLPRKLKTKLRSPPSWPSTPSRQLAQQPKSCPPTLDILLISAPGLITNLKNLAKNHVDPKSSSRKAATLHSIIHTLALVALYSAIKHSSPSFNDDGFSLVLGSATPISLREEPFAASKRRERFSLAPAIKSPPPTTTITSSLPVTSGNFVSSYADTFTIRPEDTFWNLTNTFATTLASPKGRRLAKMHMGMLGYIPDYDHSEKVTDDMEKNGGGGEGYVNGWEKFFGGKGDSSTPFDSAFTISNLGFLDIGKLGVECPLSTITDTKGNQQQLLLEEVPPSSSPTVAAVAGEGATWKIQTATWAQSHTPQGEAFGIDVVGFSPTSTLTGDQTLSIAISSRAECFADLGLHDRFKTYLRRLVLAFAATNDHMQVLVKNERISPQETKIVDGLDLARKVPSFDALARCLKQSEPELA